MVIMKDHIQKTIHKIYCTHWKRKNLPLQAGEGEKKNKRGKRTDKPGSRHNSILQGSLTELQQSKRTKSTQEGKKRRGLIEKKRKLTPDLSNENRKGRLTTQPTKKTFSVGGTGRKQKKAATRKIGGRPLEKNHLGKTSTIKKDT